MNQWAASGEKQDEERYGQFWELSSEGEQRCFEDTKDSQAGETDASWKGSVFLSRPQKPHTAYWERGGGGGEGDRVPMKSSSLRSDP